VRSAGHIVAKPSFLGERGGGFLRAVSMQGPQKYQYNTTEKYRGTFLQSWWKCSAGSQ